MHADALSFNFFALKVKIGATRIGRASAEGALAWRRSHSEVLSQTQSKIEPGGCGNRGDSNAHRDGTFDRISTETS
jgi:hypothetical protein